MISREKWGNPTDPCLLDFFRLDVAIAVRNKSSKFWRFVVLAFMVHRQEKMAGRGGRGSVLPAIQCPLGE